MFYIFGVHKQFGNVVYVEKQKDFVRPNTCVLHAEAFDMIRVPSMLGLFNLHWPDYEWTAIAADSQAIIPDNMREVLGI